MEKGQTTPGLICDVPLGGALTREVIRMVVELSVRNGGSKGRQHNRREAQIGSTEFMFWEDS